MTRKIYSVALFVLLLSLPHQAAAGLQDEKGSGKQSQAGQTEASSGLSTQSIPMLARKTEVSKSSTEFLGLFEDVVADAVAATVKIKTGSRQRALGAIVDSDGFVVTKQSELRGSFVCVLSDGREVSGYVYGIHKPTDLALLKIDADKLPVVKWNDGQAPAVGSWLASVGQEATPMAVGVVGVPSRKIPAEPGFMGVDLEESDVGVRIRQVIDDTPAERAGIKQGDLVIKVGSKQVEDIPELQQTVGAYSPGTELRITLLRDSKEIVLTVTLGVREDLDPNRDRANEQNSMGSFLSQRRHDFPLAVQHDTGLSRRECGGPVVDIDGKVVGINIARSGRVATLMLPADLVVSVVEELKSGQLAPAVVNKDKIDEINRALEELQTTINLAPAGKEELTKKLEELKKTEKEALEALQAAMQGRVRLETRIENAAEAQRVARREKDRLERELKKLVSGTK